MEKVELKTLPNMESNYELREEQQSYYREHGHILLRNVASKEEVTAYRPVIGDVVKEHAMNALPLEKRDTYGKAFIQVCNLWPMSEAVRKYVFARRFAKIAADLMGVEGVRIYHDQALFKEPGGGHTPWHQDQVYWPLDTPNVITMWMPLVDISEEVGSMTFASGTQKLGYVSRQVISDESHRTLGQYIESKGIPTVNYGAMNAGDVTFHAGWTLHSAPGNPTDTMREVMTIIYIADGVTIAEPDSNARKADLATWFPGLKPGDLAASEINPLLYHSSKTFGG